MPKCIVKLFTPWIEPCAQAKHRDVPGFNAFCRGCLTEVVYHLSLTTGCQHARKGFITDTNMRCVLRRAHSMEDAARRADVLSRRNAGKRRRRACAQDASSSSSSEEDEEADARKGDASAPGAAAAAGGRAGGQTGGKTVVPPSGDELLGALVRAGLLVRHSTGTVAMMRLSAPGVGSVVRSWLAI